MSETAPRADIRGVALMSAIADNFSVISASVYSYIELKPVLEGKPSI
jgi:hypothetical protein